MKILIVDDKEEERYLAETLLKGSGYEVVTAVNGAEALEKLRTEDFDMIVSDVLMPVMDGFRLCRECKGDEKLKDIPFVFYTATYKDERDEELASKVGADKYIRKPLEPGEFVKVIQGLGRDIEEGKIGPKKLVLEEEKEVLKLYSERLIEKLEKKMLDLEAEVTERKQMQEELQIAEQNFRNSLDSSPLGIRIVTAEGKLLYANQAILDIYGYSSVEELKAVPTKQRYTPESYAGHQERIKRRNLGKPAPPNYEISIVRKDGEIRHLVASRKEVMWGGETQFQAIYQDITERKRAEEELRESEEHFRALIENSSDIIQIVDSEGVIRYVSPSVQQVLGYKPEELIGRPSVDVVHPDDLPIVAKGFEKAIQEPGVPVIVECRCKHKDGTWHIIEGIGMNHLDDGYDDEKEILGRNAVEFWQVAEEAVEVMQIAMDRGGWIGELVAKRKDGSFFDVQLAASAVRDKAGKPICRFGSFVDITERKQAEKRIKQTAEEWSTTFDSISDLVFINDKDSRLIRVNKAFADVAKMKPEELIGRPCYEIVHGTNEPVQKCPYKQAIKTKKPAMAEFFEPHLGMHLELSTSSIFDQKGETVASVHVARDITERKRMEEQLIVADRLASIGELSSGIAHELNNPLTSVIGFSDLLLGKEDLPDDIKGDLEVINREAKRTAEVVRNLLTFARKREAEKKPVDIHNIIQKVLELRAYEQKVSNIEVNTQFASDLPEITADGFQLQQIFINIIINAEHFMIEAHRRGTLTITTERIGDIIRASFADDGPGIAKENLGHLFDPFFTTKEVGKGTGLGLSICHGITTEHGGRIYAESKLGKGATFVVELPISK